MAFSGKATYTSGATLPEISEDVSDLVGILSPHETPLLDALGDPLHFATSTHHEWLEDELLPNYDKINDSGISDGSATVTSFAVANGSRFRIGDQIRAIGSREVILVTGISGNTLTVTRGYGGTTRTSLTNSLDLYIIGNAALEGADSDGSRFTVRSRKSNYTQIFSAGVQVSGTEAAVRQIAVDDEMDYQKTNRLREMLRDLENTLINGCAAQTNPQGTSSTRRTMRGIISSLSTNVMVPNQGLIPDGTNLSEAQINAGLRTVWEASGSKPDLIIVGGAQKRRINAFIQTTQRTLPNNESFKNVVNVYESDYGVCRVILSRFVPFDVVLFVDSTRANVLPLSGRSFQFKPLATTGDYESGEVIGEYTCEVRNEKAHGILTGLAG